MFGLPARATEIFDIISPMEFPHAKTDIPSKSCFIPLRSPMVESKLTSSSARVKIQQTLAKNPSMMKYKRAGPYGFRTDE